LGVEIMRKLPDMVKVAEKIETPLEQWKGNCYTIACKIVKSGILSDNDARAVYGRYLGYISRGSMFATRKHLPFCPHGWIILCDQTVLDPTRWVFEALKPYMAHININTDKYIDYDEGGNRWREANIRPCPVFDESEKTFNIDLGEDCLQHLMHLMNCSLELTESVSVNQLFWIGNLPPSVLGDYANDVFQWVASIDSSFIPIDNQIMFGLKS